MFCLSQFIFIVSMPERDKKNFLDLKAICFICLCRFSVSLRGFLKKDEPKRTYSYFLHLSLFHYYRCLLFNISFFFPILRLYSPCLSLFFTSQCLYETRRSTSHLFEWKTYFLNLKAICFACLIVFLSSQCLDETKIFFLISMQYVLSVSYFFLKKGEPKRIYSYFLRLSLFYYYRCLLSYVFNISHFFQWQTHFLDLKTVFPLSPSVLFVSMPQWDKKKHVTLLNEKRIS